MNRFRGHVPDSLDGCGNSGDCGNDDGSQRENERRVEVGGEV